VKLYGAYFDEGTVKVVLELMDAGSLNDILKRIKLLKNEQPYIEEPVLAKITQQILNGLMYLNIVSHQLHRDIKPANILINTKGEVKLTDFGISKELDLTNQFSSTFVGTAVYMSPERLEAKKYNHLSDIWSVGIMLIELATGTFPLEKTRSPIEILECISNANPGLPDNVPYTQEFRNFITACLHKDINKRASAIELLMHPWILKNIQVDVDLEAWVKNIMDKGVKSAPKPPEAIPKKRLGMEVIDETEEIVRPL
jgi:serine/threonine protein kinase